MTHISVWFAEWARDCLTQHLFPPSQDSMSWVLFWRSESGMRGQIHLNEVSDGALSMQVCSMQALTSA